MTPERWKEIEEVFERARDLPPDNRAAFVARECNGDDELKHEVESLLASHAEAGEFIDRPSLFLSAHTLEEAGATLACGERIGAYRVVRQIGRGGMGAVYLAERADAQFEQRVAIKVIKRGMDTDAVLRHFRNERQILASFDHPNIARLFDGGSTRDGLPYFVMEYVEAQPIDTYSEAHRLSVTQRLGLFREVCAAVSYAHQHAVIHRDIKPSNIVVTKEGKPKLLDFGIAKMLQASDGADALMTATGVRAMTPEFASPEQARGEPVTTATDVYSLGVVLYELLTGCWPYSASRSSPQEVTRAITDTEPRKPSTAIRPGDRVAKAENRKSLKGDLDNILLMALRKEPTRRYKSVEQFSDDIRRHLEARPVLARKDTFSYRAARFVRRNRIATAAAVLVLLSLIGGLLATTWQAQRANAQKARAERRFNDVRQLAHSVLFDYHDAIKDLPGATRVRERLVQDALRYLDSLSTEATDDPQLQRELAGAYERVADVRGEANAASIGDRAGAWDSYRKALAIREALLAAAPGSREDRRQLATSYKKLGNQLLETSEAQRGVEYLRKALVIASQLVEEQPADADLRYELADTCTAVGSALQATGDMPGALQQLHKARPIFEDLLHATPQDRRIRRSLSVVDQEIARTSFLTNDTKGALENNQKALALREALLAEEPTNADYRRILAISYQDDGDYRAWVKDNAGALASFRKKLNIDEQSLAADPANAQARSDLAYSCIRMGELLTGLEDHGQAAGFYGRAAELYHQLGASDRQDELVPMREASSHAHLGRAYAKLGKVRAADDECGKANQLLTAATTNVANMMAGRLRAIACGDLADAYAALAATHARPADRAADDWHAARDMYRRTLSLLEDLQKRGVLDAEEIPELDKTRQKIAECNAALPNH